jgi:hypothetical protein
LFVLSICLEFVAALCLRMSKSETKTFQSRRKPCSLAVDATHTVNLVSFYSVLLYIRPANNNSNKETDVVHGGAEEEKQEF